MKSKIDGILIALSIIIAGIGGLLLLNPELISRLEEPQEDHLEYQEGSIYALSLNKKLIKNRIEQGKDFLLRTDHENLKGFYKYYYPSKDKFGEQLVTCYTASIIFTLLYYNKYYEENEELLEKIPEWGDFLISMQNKDKDDKTYGAFHYSYHLTTGEKEKKFVVGTSALCIFTLLDLYELTKDPKYLKSAKLAGNWLTTMQNPDGTMTPYLRKNGAWYHGTKESLLYEGQVLSSLSRLYKVTKKKDYYETAEEIADRFADKYEREEGYVKGEYRDKNPISNSWVVMSLMDFYKVSQEDRYKKIVFELSRLILKNQIRDEYDLEDYGRWRGSYSTSGIGWICEVSTETYRFCKAEEMENCEEYKHAVTKGIRWIIQNTYSEKHRIVENIPDRAIGGVFWNKNNRYVRTDSVCHALNGYIRILDYLEDGILVDLPRENID